MKVIAEISTISIPTEFSIPVEPKNGRLNSDNIAYASITVVPLTITAAPAPPTLVFTLSL